MTEQQKQKYATANDFCRITPDLLWYHPEFNILGIQNLSVGSWTHVEIEEPIIANCGIVVRQVWVHDFGTLGWVLIGDL